MFGHGRLWPVVRRTTIAKYYVPKLVRWVELLTLIAAYFSRVNIYVIKCLQFLYALVHMNYFSHVTITMEPCQVSCPLASTQTSRPLDFEKRQLRH